MAMRRGKHTSRVMKALGTRADNGEAVDLLDLDPDALPEEGALPNAFDE
jgi:acetolactate synthase-1/3 small subunit